MYAQNVLREEIAELVLKQYNRQEVIDPAEVALRVISSHIKEFSQGADFVCFCAWHTVRKEVGNYLTKLFRDSEGNIHQHRFPGFEYVQMAYLVGTDEDAVVIPTEKATAEQLDQIFARLEREGNAKLKHAREVMKYRIAKYGAPRLAA